MTNKAIKPIVPSSNKTEEGSWNNFDSDDLHRFLEKYNPEFVDLNEDCWRNDESTVVIKVPNQVSWKFVRNLMDLRADEFDYKDAGYYTILRLWWD